MSRVRRWCVSKGRREIRRGEEGEGRGKEERDDLERDMLDPTAEILRRTQEKLNALEKLALKDRECSRCTRMVTADYAQVALLICMGTPRPWGPELH